MARGFANHSNRANAVLSMKPVSRNAHSRAIRNPLAFFASLRLCVSPCPAPRIRRMPHAGMEDLTPWRRGNARTYLCGFAPLREPLTQSWHERLTPRRRETSRQGAKPQRKCSSDLCAFACAADLTQRFDECLTARRRKISRQGAKPQKKPMAAVRLAVRHGVSRASPANQATGAIVPLPRLNLRRE